MCTAGRISSLRITFYNKDKVNQAEPKSIVSDLCSVLSTECEDLGIQSWAPLSVIGSDQNWFSWVQRSLICMSYCYCMLWSWTWTEGSPYSRYNTSNLQLYVTEFDYVWKFHIHLFLV